MKTGLLGFGALIWALPLQAQDEAADPLAPIEQPAPTVVQPPAVVVPRDWRGVFDAIDAGQWASAQAGINALPVNVLTPVAKAQLYTAKGSPTVSLVDTPSGTARRSSARSRASSSSSAKGFTR